MVTYKHCITLAYVCMYMYKRPCRVAGLFVVCKVKLSEHYIQALDIEEKTCHYASL